MTLTILCLAVLIVPWIYWHHSETQTWHEGEGFDR